MNTRDSIPVARMRWNLRISVNRTRNSRAFQPAIPVRVFTEILLVIVGRIEGIDVKNAGLHPQVDQFGRLPVDVDVDPPVDQVGILLVAGHGTSPRSGCSGPQSPASTEEAPRILHRDRRTLLVGNPNLLKYGIAKSPCAIGTGYGCSASTVPAGHRWRQL
jgi:hypothetical protein